MTYIGTLIQDERWGLGLIYARHPTNRKTFKVWWFQARDSTGEWYGEVDKNYIHKNRLTP